MRFVALAATIVLAYFLGRLDGRRKLPRRRPDVIAGEDLQAFEGRLAEARPLG